MNLNYVFSSMHSGIIPCLFWGYNHLVIIMSHPPPHSETIHLSCNTSKSPDHHVD